MFIVAFANARKKHASLVDGFDRSMVFIGKSMTKTEQSEQVIHGDEVTTNARKFCRANGSILRRRKWQFISRLDQFILQIVGLYQIG
jgi:hypothetical protein